MSSSDFMDISFCRVSTPPAREWWEIDTGTVYILLRNLIEASLRLIGTNLGQSNWI